MFKILNSIFWLGLGVFILVIFTSTYLAAFILHTLYVLARGSEIKYVQNVWIAFDCLWNTILMGHPKETFSSRLGKIIWHNAPTRIPDWVVYRLVRLLNVIDRNHCRNSIDWKYGWQKSN